MRSSSVVALVAAVTVAAALASGPADAARKRHGYRVVTERLTFIDETGRVRTRVTVRPRSYLDGGTEVLPGERKFMDYAMPPTFTPYAVGTRASQRWPLPGPFELPGYSPYSYW